MDNYPRTNNPYDLDEIIFISCELLLGSSVQELAEITKRSPAAIKYKFLDYRGKNKDGTYNIKTVKGYKVLG